MHRRIAELTQAVSLGDAEALTQFYREWFDWMFAAARAFTRRDEAFCLDVVHDAMVKVIKSIKRMESRDDLERWLSTVVKRSAIDRMRRERRQTAREQAVGEDHSGQPTMKTTTEEREWLKRAVRALDPRDQDLIMARHRFELTLAEIGRTSGHSPGAVHGRISRLLARLRRDAKEAFDAV